MKKMTLLPLLLLIINTVCAADVARGEKCQSEGRVGKSTAGAIMTCQNNQYEHTVFRMINLQLVAGQIAQDPSGCLYVVTVENATFSLTPAKGDDGKQLCGRAMNTTRSTVGKEISMGTNGIIYVDQISRSNHRYQSRIDITQGVE